MGLDQASIDVDLTVTLTEFVAHRDETAAPPLISSNHGTLCPAAGCVILVAKTGDGKTTFTVEAVLHAAAGIDYIGLSFPATSARPRRRK